MKFRISHLIIGLILFYLPVDTLNGLLVRNIDFSVSTIYKSVILILILFYLIQQNQFSFIKWIVVFIILILYHAFDGALDGIEIAWAIKFLSIVFSFLFFKKIIELGNEEVIVKLAKISFWVIFLNVIIGLAGFGYAQYARDDVGTRGLFFAGNELGVLLLVISLILLSKFLIENNHRSYLFYSILFIFIATNLATKTALFGQVLIIFSLPFIHLKQTGKKLIIKKSSLKLIGFSLTLIFIGLPFLVNYVLYEMNLIARISFWAEKVGVFTLIFSGRDLRAIEVLEYLKTNSNFLPNIFGYGYTKFTQILYGNVVEIDFIDIFMTFGVIGVVTMYGFLIMQFFRKANSKHFRYRPYVKFGVLLLLILSSSSGHVLNSGMAGIMIGAFLSLQYLDFRKFSYE